METNVVTTGVVANKYINAIRKPGEAAEIEVANYNDMIEAVVADQLTMHTSNLGVDYLHIVNSATGNYLSIKVGKKVPADLEPIDYLLHYQVYTGTSENGRWFTFGPQPTPNEPTKVQSIADLRAAIQKLGDRKS